MRCRDFADTWDASLSAVDRLREKGYEATAVLHPGHPGCELITFADSACADYIAVGFRASSGDHDHVTGSVSESVVLYAPWSVVAFRQQRYCQSIM